MKTTYLHILEKVATRIRTIYPNTRVLAFGSQTRGTATEESDLDVCVILKEVKPDDRIAVSDIAWEVGFDHDILISTIVISEDEYENGTLSVTPLIESIKYEGVAA